MAHDARRPVRTRMATALLLAVLMLGASGCASSAGNATADTASPSPEPSASVSVTAAAGEAVSGNGPTESFPGIAFPIPDDARSVVIDFECAGGGHFTVELGDSMMLGQAPLSGICDGPTRLAWPVTDRTGSTLGVGVAEGVDWVATPTFSSADFVYDPALTAECERFSQVYSALTNADAGLTHYQAFDEAEWTARVDQAAADLGTLATSAQSALGESFAQLQAIVSDSSRTVGFSLSADTQAPIATINAACNTNHTPVIVMAEFGG